MNNNVPPFVSINMKKIKKNGVLQWKEEPSLGWDTYVSVKLHQ